MPSNADEIDLNCLLVDVNGKRLEFFTAIVLINKTVDVLRRFIVKENPAFFPGSRLPVLRKLTKDVLVTPSNTLAQRIQELEADQVQYELAEPGDKISKHFKDRFPDEYLHLIVYVSNDPKRKKRETEAESEGVSDSGSDNVKVPLKRPGSPLSDLNQIKRRKDASPHYKNVAATSPIYELWEGCWNRHSVETKVFERRNVEPQSQDPSVPSSCWVLKVAGWINEFLPAECTSGFMIREEYIVASRAAIQFFVHGTSCFLTDQEEQNFLSSCDDILVNPFSHLSSGIVTRSGGFILLGHPGIGKTAWLHVVLVWRLLAGLTTIYQSSKHELFVFSPEGVSCVDVLPVPPRATEFRSNFPKSTWCLIDSNQEVTDVPVFITKLKFFIVQASSPRSERLDWKNKSNYPVIEYCMKPWSLSEILAGRMLQETVIEENRLQDFFHKFGPSARLAYTYGAHADSYENILQKKISAITFQGVGSLLRGGASMTMTEESSYRLILISPGENRGLAEASIATRYLYEQIRNQLGMNRMEAASSLYSMFLHTPQTRAGAGYALGDAIHHILCKGGEWAIKRMVANTPGPKNTHWKTNETTASEGLRLLLGYSRPLMIITDQLPDGTVHNALPFHLFRHGEALDLKDGYYCPTQSNEETLDAFIYDASMNTATILQSTVSSHHSVKLGAFKWLKELGVENFQYIAVTPPNTSLDLPFPNSLRESIWGVFQLTIESF